MVQLFGDSSGHPVLWVLARYLCLNPWRERRRRDMATGRDQLHDERRKLCPSAQPEMPNSKVFGVVEGTVEHRRVAYVDRTVPVTSQILILTEPLKPTEIFRFAAPCAQGSCHHFRSSQCQLATRTAHGTEAVVIKIPACAIREDCLWWYQEGKAACLRCPQVITALENPTDEQRRVANPDQ